MPDSSELPASVTAPRFRLEAPRWLASHAEPFLVGAGSFLLTSAVAFSDGGYFSDSWAWVALLTLVVATVRLILVPTVPLRRLDWAFLGGLAAFVAWVALSGLWAPAFTPVADETLRGLSYASVVLLALLIVRRETVEALLVGTLLGVTTVCSYALLERLQPDRIGDWDPAVQIRLAGPIGYWNGLGVFAAMGALLALGLVARSGSRTVQAVAGAVPVLLLPTILFTFSRGAWLALAVGLAVAFLVDPRRLQLLAALVVVGVAPGVVLIVAARSDHLTRRTVTLREAADEGGALLKWIVILAVLSALAGVAFRLACARIHVGARTRRTIGAVVIAGAVVAAVGAFAVYGAPWTLTQRGVDAFRAPPKASGSEATGRLFDLSSNGRVDQWRVSVDQFRDSPVIGDGAGSYEAAWNLERPGGWNIRHSHSLYVETLGELGVVGLILLVLFLGVPLVVGVKARQQPLVTATLAAYSAYLAHAGVDWDWELPGVTLVALLAGVAAIVSGRDEERGTPRSTVRMGLPVVTGGLALVALVAVLATVPLGRSRAAYDRFDFAEAASQARRAERWAPWSSEALDLRGRAELALGQTDAARLSLERATRKSPNDWELWRDLSAAAPPPQARAALERARELNPFERELVQLEKQLVGS